MQTDFLVDGGRAGALIRSMDWDASALGPRARWPLGLQIALNLVLGSGFPMFMAWGDALTYFYNDAFIDILADRHPSSMGRPFASLAPEAWDTIRPLVDAALAGRNVFHANLQFHLMRKGYPETAWFTVSYSPLRDERGAVRGILGVCIETTGQVLGERSRMEEITRLRDLFEHAPGPVVVVSGPEHRYELSNAANQRYLNGRNIIGQTVREVVPEPLATQVVALLDQVYQSGEPFVGHGMPADITDAAGQPMRAYLDVVFQPIRDAAGRVVGIYHQATDVTETVRAHEALRASEERLRRGMAAARMLVWDLDLATGTITSSDNAAELLGAADGDLERRLSQVHPDDVPAFRAAVEQARTRGTSFQLLVRRQHSISGQWLWFDTRGHAVSDAQGRVTTIQGISIDVSERVRANLELQDASRRKDEFLAMLAHELRNPLAPIATAAEILKLPDVDTASAAQATEVIDRQVRHMTALVDDLLDVSRVTRGLVQLQRTVCDMKAVVAAAVEQSRPLVEARRHALTIRTGAADILVDGDRTRLVQVTANLLNNAAKFTAPAGEIVLELDVDGDAAVLGVTDNGCGIEAALLPLVFELFTQGQRTPDRAQGGLGIGLALVRSIVGLHGGTVEAHSAGAQRGSRFTVRLPRVHAQAAAPAAPVHTAPGTPLSILIVDDNADAARLLGRLLEAHGHRVSICFDGAAAVALTRSKPFDLCVLDIGLPDMTGYELLAALRGAGAPSRMVAVALTGYGQERDLARSLAAGFDHHLVKPVDGAQFARIVADTGQRA